MDLIIVESPTKAKTLSRFLGGKYDVRATYGHVRDLPERKLGVDVRNNFKPDYVMVTKQKDRVKELEAAAHQAGEVYLATDPDREGEAIAFHVAEILKGDGANKATGNYKRIEFHEITETAVSDALSHPRLVDMKLVEAQQARRILDRLVGYKLSPLLWKKVRKGLSAGRVQSVAVRLIAEREREIEAFVPEEYWVVSVILNKSETNFKVLLTEKNGEKFKVTNKTAADDAEKDLRGGEYIVSEVEKREIKKTPTAPFTTSTLQQAAANKLGWSAKKTMQVAQMLYEEGYITYHRTDSTNLAAEAVRAAGEYIAATYGREYALDIPRLYKTKSKVAQEAHEAIRPTKINLKSEELAAAANRDQEKLYELIWKRFTACQMAEARGVAVTVSVGASSNQGNTYKLQARGETITFDGWLKIYNSQLKIDNSETEENNEKEVILPELAEGEKLKFIDLTNEQKFTQPPARFNDASLIKALEERGIGRPSTYAPTLSTIQDRQYVERVEKRFKPTALGFAVNDFLVKNFPKIVDFGFTAKMEDDLDNIANGELAWIPTIAEFYNPFEKDLERVAEVAERVKVEVETTGEKCPTCGQGDVVIRIGKFGKFLACSRYPDCGYKANYKEKIGVKCPSCGGDVILRKTKSRKSFFGCSNYPNCKFASWTRPSQKATEGTAKPEAVVKLPNEGKSPESTQGS